MLDHDVSHDLGQTKLPFGQLTTLGPFGYNGGVLSFTGELFISNTQYPEASIACYQKSVSVNQSSTWSNILKNTYIGTPQGNCYPSIALNYDNHPGYDYAVSSGTPVYPAASGYIISVKCIKTFTNTSSCEDYGAVAIDHGNGFVTQYLHLKNVYYGTAVNGQNQYVNGGYVTSLGTVGKVGLPATAGVHLHFEVLQRKVTPVNTTSYYHRSNYVIVDSLWIQNEFILRR